MEIAHSMKAATKQSSELRTPNGSVPVNLEIQFTTTGKTCYRCGSKGHPQEKYHFKAQNVTIVTRRYILLRYAGHPQDNQTRKIQPSIEQPKVQENIPIF